MAPKPALRFAKPSAKTPNRAMMVRPSPARERAMSSPAKSMTRTVKLPMHRYDRGGIIFIFFCFLFALLVAGYPHGGTPVHDPPDRKHHQAIVQRSEMISVRKESDSLSPIAELEEAKRTLFAPGRPGSTLSRH